MSVSIKWGDKAEQAPPQGGGGVACYLGGWGGGDEKRDSLLEEGIWDGLLKEVAFGDGP